MVFYFTGTGNSLYVAKQLGEERVSIPQLMRQKKKIQDAGKKFEFTAERIGIAAPVYGHEVPPMVKEFLKQSVFHTEYFYMILTYGNRHGGAAELAHILCKECGISVNYINVVWMADNWLPAFDMEEQKTLNKGVEEQLEVIRNDLKSRRNWISPVTDTDRAAHRQFLEGMSRMPEDAWQHLIQIKDGCVGCGICERVCPSDSISVENGRAVHIPGNCQTCLACVHACPEKAIGLAVPEKNPNARYRNAQILLKEIMDANGKQEIEGGF